MSVNVDVAPLPELADRSKTWRAPDSSLGRSRERLAWLLVLPSLLVVAIVALYPLIETFRLSFTNTRLASTREPRSVGFDNYQSLLQEDAFRSALSHTVIFTISSVLLETFLGLAIALVIHSNFRAAVACAPRCSCPGPSQPSSPPRCGSGCTTMCLVS